MPTVKDDSLSIVYYDALCCGRQISAGEGEVGGGARGAVGAGVGYLTEFAQVSAASVRDTARGAKIRQDLRMKLKGTIRRSDVEGGHWTLVVEGGDQYQLTGAVSGAKDGLHVEVEGKVDKQAMSFGMMGPLFAVSKLKALKLP